MTDYHPSYYDEHRGNIKKVAELIEQVDVCMMTTRHEDGTLTSRPMRRNQKAEFDGHLWFFTFGSARKAQDIQDRPHVNLSFERPDEQIYVSIHGQAELVRDRQKIEELWEPALKPWFPEGKDTADLALLKVRAQGAEYWDGTKSTAQFLFESVKAIATGAPPDIGDNQKLPLE